MIKERFLNFLSAKNYPLEPEDPAPSKGRMEVDRGISSWNVPENSMDERKTVFHPGVGKTAQCG